MRRPAPTGKLALYLILEFYTNHFLQSPECNGKAPSPRCFGKDHHMVLCENCGVFISAKHGCGEHDRHGFLDLKLREKLDPSRDGQKTWRILYYFSVIVVQPRDGKSI